MTSPAQWGAAAPGGVESSAAGPGVALRLALRVMQLGAIAVVLAVTLHRSFELDRFFIPKELVLHVTALLAGLLTMRRVRMTRFDLLLLASLGLGAVSAIFATNPWLALRALAISASSLVLFWSARALRDAGLARPLLGALAFAVVLAVATSLIETYGIDLIFFSESRAPGGTLGNRNFIAHAAAFGMPLLLLAATRSWLGMFGAALATAALVLTRSRAAWLAFAAVLAVVLLAMLFSPALRRDRRIWLRLFATLALTAIGVGAALVIPNTLRWRSDNPYLESVQRVADFREGSGRGRVIQYERSLMMALHHPLLGVGPGNWSVEYPDFATRNDPSMSDAEGGVTNNPWPSSDWVAWTSERGFAAVALLLLVIIGIALHGVRQLVAAQDVEEALLAMTLLGTLAGAGVTGLFDAVLLLALPAFLVWSALGALWSAATSVGALKSARAGMLLVIIITAIGAARSAAQITAMQIYSTRTDRASLTRAARIDPGNYRVRLRLARGGRKRCEHALAARALFPHADAARAAARGCK